MRGRCAVVPMSVSCGFRGPPSMASGASVWMVIGSSFGSVMVRLSSSWIRSPARLRSKAIEKLLAKRCFGRPPDVGEETASVPSGSPRNGMSSAASTGTNRTMFQRPIEWVATTRLSRRRILMNRELGLWPTGPIQRGGAMIRWCTLGLLIGTEQGLLIGTEQRQRSASGVRRGVVQTRSV